MATKNFNARISLKYDSYANWIANDPVLLVGEVAIATIPTKKDGIEQVPAVVMKVGDGTKKYSELQFVSGLAADIYDWAKAATKPSYSANEITGLSDYISGQIQDTNTQYQIVVDAENPRKFQLQSHEKGVTEWTNVGNPITIPASVLETGTTNGTVKFNGTEVAVAGLKSAAYTESTAYDEAGAAAAVLGKEADDSTKATVYGARALASAKVGSVGATANAGIEISGTATVPTVGIKLDPAAGNAASLSAAGLLVTVPAAAEYTIAKLTTAETGYLATYQLQKDGTGVGEKINIPKDYLVKSAAVKTSTGAGDPSGFPKNTKYIDFTINTYDTQTGSGTESHIYLNVADLVDVYTSGSAAGDAIQIAISGDNKISATVTNKGITLAMLSDGVQASLGKADTALQKASITTGSTNGTISVGGTDVAVKGLDSAAYAKTTDFDSAGAAAGVLGSNADAAGAATVYGANKAAAAAQAKADANATEIAKKIDATAVSAIGKSGNINDAVQTAGDYIIFNCGSSNTVI